VHGCHLQADAWEEIVFGSIMKQQLGRAAKAALLTHQESPACVVFGTGGSEKDGKLEVSIADAICRPCLTEANHSAFAPKDTLTGEGAKCLTVSTSLIVDVMTGAVHAGLFARALQKIGPLPRIQRDPPRRVSRCRMFLLVHSQSQLSRHRLRDTLMQVAA
jgi:hypothetical protein